MLIRKLPRWGAPVVVVLVLGVLLAWFAWPASTRPAAGPAVPRPGFLLSYAGAEDRLTGMGELEGAEQLRDWARTGLAADLELDTEHLAYVDYDTLPVRDGGFSDLARQPVGPGRFLFADGVLHLLVPGADPHQDRTIALLLDQYRTDAGGDPPRVQLHRYTVLPEIRAIQIGADDPVATEEFRRGHGYVRMRMRIDDPRPCVTSWPEPAPCRPSR
jgi:hypothetical protein